MSEKLIIKSIVVNLLSRGPLSLAEFESLMSKIIDDLRRRKIIHDGNHWKLYVADIVDVVNGYVKLNSYGIEYLKILTS